MLDRIPKVFISYSWTSEEYKQTVIDLATRLRLDGVNVVLDVWDLKPGHDKYAFMEQSVTDPSIDRVLILCDKKYAEKANKRQGGVGDETVIISADVYGKVEQDKFIPVVMEKDDDGHDCLPVYLRSILYIDMTGEHYEEGYERLLRTIFNQPEKRRPELGAPPSWLFEDEASESFRLKKAIQVITKCDNQLKKVELQGFLDKYVEALKPFYKKSHNGWDEYLQAFKSMKEYRDIFLDFLSSISNIPHAGRTFAEIFEKLHNTLYNINTFVLKHDGYCDNEFDIFRVHVWELFVCTVTYMLHFEMYEAINELLVHTYYLKSSPIGDDLRERSYKGLWFYPEMLENVVKPNLEEKLRSRYTLTGYLICTEREYKPVFTAKNIANADLFLYQVYKALPLEQLEERSIWFPRLYVYSDDNKSFWMRLKSHQFCEKIMPLFGVQSITELKEAIKECRYDDSYKYSGSFQAATAILNWVKLEEVGSLP